jgi:hypothetical protein
MNSRLKTRSPPGIDFEMCSFHELLPEMLYARLFCGLRFFDKNHKMTREFPAMRG